MSCLFSEILGVHAAYRRIRGKRQAKVTVAAMKEVAFLIPVERVVGLIVAEPYLPQCPTMRFNRELEQQLTRGFQDARR